MAAGGSSAGRGLAFIKFNDLAADIRFYPMLMNHLRRMHQLDLRDLARALYKESISSSRTRTILNHMVGTTR